MLRAPLRRLGRRIAGDGGLGTDRQLRLDGGDLGLEAGGVVGAVLGLGPMLLLDEFDELKFEAHDMVFQTRIGHVESFPRVLGR